MIVDEVHVRNSNKQSQWLERLINFKTRKRNKAQNKFEKVFFTQTKNGLFRKMLENNRNRIKIELIKKFENE